VAPAAGAAATRRSLVVFAAIARPLYEEPTGTGLRTAQRAAARAEIPLTSPPPSTEEAFLSAPPSAQYRLRIRVQLDDAHGALLADVTSAIGEAGGIVAAIDAVEVEESHSLRDIVVDASDQQHWQRIIEAVDALEGAQVIDAADRTFQLHLGGKIEQRNKHPLMTRDDLSMVYTPGVARVCLAIAHDPDKAFQYTVKRNTVAVVSDGSAVLGLGSIGARAAMPVMEGKCCLFKEFAGVDAFPICLDTADTEEIVRAVTLIAPAFGGINLEDISAPRCFEIEERLKQQLEIPVFHDDQHGTAVVVMAALLNAVKLTDRRLEDLKVLLIGLGAAGIAVTKILLEAGVSDIIGADSQGALHVDREDYLDGSMNPMKRWFTQATNPERRSGSPADVIDGADLLIGVSGARALPAEALARMNRDAMVFAMANPNPEVNPEEAAPYVRIVATGRSDYPNQINNVLCFPGIFRGALDVRAPAITEEMKMAAAQAIAAIVEDSELREDYIIPSVFNRDVAPAVAAAVADQARAAGTALAGHEVGFAPGETITGGASAPQVSERRV
jgi:malate dehydrogenase (oxaloacetate-decarboxylating)